MQNGQSVYLPKSKYISYKSNPALFVKEVLDNNKRWSKQTEIIESVRDNRNTYVKSCHGVGKTYTAKDVALWFLYCFHPATVLTTAPSWPQVEKLLWSEINFAHANAKTPLGGMCKKTELFLDDNWFALGISPRIDSEDEAKRLTGFHNENLLVIFDEAPACHPMLWEIKETLMTSENVRFLGIGNPVEGHGHFFDGFSKKYVNSISMNVFDSPNFISNGILNIEDLVSLSELDLDKRELEFGKMLMPFSKLTTPRWAVERLEEWGVDSPLFQTRVLAKFPDKSTDTIISYSELESCIGINPTGKHAKTLGVDVARFGTDDTVFIGYGDYKQTCKERFNGQNLVKTANMIKAKIKNEKYKVIVIDDTGLGGGVTDILNEWIADSVIKGVTVLAVNFAQKSSFDEYEGIVTQMYYNVKDMLKDKEIQVVKDGRLFGELSSRKYKFTTKGKIKVESKDEYKKRTGSKSPDEGDAFILCAWGVRQGRGSAESFSDVEGREFASEW